MRSDCFQFTVTDANNNDSLGEKFQDKYCKHMLSFAQTCLKVPVMMPQHHLEEKTALNLNLLLLKTVIKLKMSQTAPFPIFSPSGS